LGLETQLLDRFLHGERGRTALNSFNDTLEAANAEFFGENLCFQEADNFVADWAAALGGQLLDPATQLIRDPNFVLEQVGWFSRHLPSLQLNNIKRY